MKAYYNHTLLAALWHCHSHYLYTHCLFFNIVTDRHAGRHRTEYSNFTPVCTVAHEGTSIRPETKTR